MSNIHDASSGRQPEPRTPTPAPVRVSPLGLRWATLLGISLEQLAVAAKVDVERLRSASTFSHEDGVRLWEALEAITGDPCVGLRAGQSFRLDQMSLVGPAIAHAPTVDAALDVLVRLLQLLIRGADVDRFRTTAGGGVRYRLPAGGSRHGPDAIFAATLTVLRECVDAPLAPAQVDLEANPPRDPAPYEAVFHVRPRWEASTNALVFAPDVLARPMRGAAPPISDLLLEHAPSLLSRAEDLDDDTRIERAFWAARRRSPAITLDDVARELDISARTLQRRLAAEGRTFAALRDALLRERARELLTSSTHNVEEIAELLGYSARSSFERAFSRWFGTTPAAMRAQRGDGGSADPDRP
ncbi:MAG: AraC family transcriptional regulator ligand-binding domain-containing protein [Myxococcales bacterium]|nr:AraC family transcriptional regulator ligand-binding domain-containing protein [Myxococcales bacterium]